MSGPLPHITSIPVELLLDILEHLTVSDEESCRPSIGSNAAWIIPEVRVDPSQKPASQDSRTETEKTTEEEKDETTAKANTTIYYPIQSLRSTCKYLEQLCTPMLFRNSNLSFHVDNLQVFQKITNFIVIPHWQHIRSLTVFVDSEDALLSVAQEKHVAGILSVCKNLTSLSLYYYQTVAEMQLINREVLHLLEQRQLSELGIYSISVLQEPYAQTLPVPSGAIALLDSIASSTSANRTLRVLDVVIESIPRITYDLIRMNLTSLRSLTIRRALRNTLGRVWDLDEHTKWKIGTNVTKLQLINCQPAYAGHVPHLVRHFRLLKELMISTCGDDLDIKTWSHPQGWSRQTDALCNVRPPLEVFHIEHMEDWEIMSLGLIPTKVLIVTTVKSNHLLNCLTRDPDLFPGMKVLRLAPRTISDLDVPEQEAVAASAPGQVMSLEAICKARRIEVRRDAEATWSCGCCGIEGY